MGFVVEETPIRTVKGILSNVVAGRSQIPFTFKRADYQNVALTLAGTNSIQLTIPNDGTIENSQINDEVYIRFNDDTNYPNKDGRYTITNVTPSGGNTILVFNVNFYTANTNTVEVNALSLFPDYRIAIQVSNEITQADIFDSPLLFRPDEEGILFLDIHELFFGFQFPLPFYRINVTYTEIGGQSQTGSSGEILAVLGFKQALDCGGANMFDYLPTTQDVFEYKRIDLAGDMTNEPIFVLDETGPTHPYVAGQFIEVVDGRYKGVHEVTAISNTPTEKWVKVDSRFLGPEVAGAGKFLGTIKRPSGKFLTDSPMQLCHQYYHKTVSFVVDANLNTREGIASVDLVTLGKNRAGTTIFTENTTYTPTAVYTHEIPTINDVFKWEIFLTDTATQTKLLSEVLEFEQVCLPVNPVNLTWQNRRGAMEQFVFGVSQNIDTKVEEGVIFERPITENLENVFSILGRTPIGASQNIVLTAENVPMEVVRTLRYIKNSPEIYLYLDQSQDKKIQVVAVENFSTPIITGSNRGDFTMTIKLPNNFEVDGRA